MAVWKEFKQFALKGNVLDLAIAVVIGAAFGKIVSSFVDNILMPPLGMVMGKTDFSSYFISLTGTHYDTLAQAKAAGAATLNYGLFINAIIDFSIVAMAMFLVVKQANLLTRNKVEAPAPTTRECPQCLSAIPIAAQRCKFCAEPLLLVSSSSAQSASQA